MALRKRSSTALVLLLAVALPAGTAHAGQVRVVEYERLWGGDGYFLTAFPSEIAALDAATNAWSPRHRSGVQFTAYDASGPGLAPVCRFYNPRRGPLGAHFLTAFAHECEIVKGLAEWTYEGVAFFAALPDGLGHCPAGTAPVYRTFDGHRHRLTYAREVRRNALAAGGTAEGAGVDGVAFCVPVTVDPNHARLIDFARGTWTFAAASGFTAGSESITFVTAALVTGSDDPDWAPLLGAGPGTSGVRGQPGGGHTAAWVAWQPYTGEIIVEMGEQMLLRLDYRGGDEVAGCWQRIEHTLDVPPYFWSAPCRPLTGRRQ